MRTCGCGAPGLFGTSTRCLLCRRRHNIHQARAKQQCIAEARKQAEADAITRQLEALARARRQQRRRLSLTDEECWGGAGVSSVYHMNVGA